MSEGFPTTESPIEERVNAFMDLLTERGAFDKAANDRMETMWGRYQQLEFIADMQINFEGPLKKAKVGDRLLFQDPSSLDEDDKVITTECVVIKADDHNLYTEEQEGWGRRKVIDKGTGVVLDEKGNFDPLSGWVIQKESY